MQQSGRSPDGVLSGEATAAPAIVPRPAQLRVLGGYFEPRQATAIRVPNGQPELRAVAEFLAKYLPGTAVVGENVSEVDWDADIVLTADSAAAASQDEAYSLTVVPQRVLLQAPSARGLFHAAQTLRQLLMAGPGAAHGWRLPAVEVRDEPRYRWRGMLLDCCRHFMTKDFIERYIDLLAYHKMNVLHLHLTDDQGWRLEIKRHPKLVEIGAWRSATRESEQPRDAAGRYGGFYSQQDIREIVAYAASRYVTVVPEIEMPGHCMAALASYPDLSCTGGPFSVWTEWGISEDVYCAGNERVYEFLENVLTEVLALFPSQFVHVGGDETPKTRWRQCPKCQARMRAEGLTDAQELQGYFVRRVARFLAAAGRRLVGWDEILEGGLASQVVVQSWRGMSGAVAAARAGHDVIVSPTTHCYLNYPESPTPDMPEWMTATPLEKAYAFELTPRELTREQARYVLGLEGTVWTERASQQRVDQMVFPRLCALAEVSWSPGELCNWQDFVTRMKAHYARLAALGADFGSAGNANPRAVHLGP